MFARLLQTTVNRSENSKVKTQWLPTELGMFLLQKDFQQKWKDTLPLADIINLTYAAIYRCANIT